MKYQAVFDRMCLEFEAVAQYRSALRRRFELNYLAPYFGIPRAEFRKLFDLWVVERANQNPASAGNTDGVKLSSMEQTHE